MRRSIKGAITRALNDALAKRTWLSKKGSRKRVSDLAHFDHLLLTYLPKHDGAQWYREKDIDAAKRRAAEKTQSEKLQSEKLQSERPQ